MGSVEKSARRMRRNKNIQKALLTAAVIGGIMLIGGAPSPAVLLGLGKKRNKYRFKNQTKTALARLVQKGFVVFVNQNGAQYARITPTGERALALELFRGRKRLDSGKRWDKRWRVVIFDIPEVRRTVRDRLRLYMRDAGFYRLQDSVWVYPHDCEDLLALLKAELKIGWAVLYMVVEKIEGDEKLKDYFNLK